jgi:hypothetical protein
MPPDPTNKARETATGNNRSPLSEPFPAVETASAFGHDTKAVREREQPGRLRTGEPSSTKREGQQLPHIELSQTPDQQHLDRQRDEARRICEVG